MSDYVYIAAAQLTDGSETVIDLEERGWADKEVLSRTVRWTLIPKDGALTMNGRPYPLVSIHIPEGARPVFKSRVYGVVGVDGSDEGMPRFRCYGIGYKLGKHTHWTWVLPTGDIESVTGDEALLFADLLLRRLKGV
jgi:hypothetical protein